ncbi:MAG: DNA methyltransferase [Candidatus Micrarchaeia archaeon]
MATHPPYASIISYTKNSNHKREGDLSKVSSINEFSDEMRKVAKEFYRVLKPGRYCAILIGDTRRHKHQVPISFRVMQVFLDAGFVLKESIIKVQHNTKTAPLWAKKSMKDNFLLLMHEHLFVFRKPSANENITELAESMKWW